MAGVPIIKVKRIDAYISGEIYPGAYTRSGMSPAMRLGQDLGSTQIVLISTHLTGILHYDGVLYKLRKSDSEGVYGHGGGHQQP